MTDNDWKTKSWLGTATAASAIAAVLWAAPAVVDPASGALAAHEGQAIKGGKQPRQGGKFGGRDYTGRGGQGSSSIEERIFRGSGSRRIIIILEDDDGDGDDGPPAWAKGNRELNPHIVGGGKPTGAGTRKGDLYGDLWVILRDENGEPVLDDNGHVQPILADGTVVQLTDDGELPPEYDELVQEVEFGRLSVARAPSKVSEHALEEALAKLEAADSVTVDAAGRLVADGVTIDSPLENLSLYSYLMTTDDIVAWLPSGFDPASLLGAAADKGGEVTIDVLVNLNTIVGVNTVEIPSGEFVYYDFSTYDYDRTVTYDALTVTYLKQDGDTWVQVTEPILLAVFEGADWEDPTADGGADDFTQSADDTRAVIEFIHAMPVPAE